MLVLLCDENRKKSVFQFGSSLRRSVMSIENNVSTHRTPAECYVYRNMYLTNFELTPTIEGYIL